MVNCPHQFILRVKGNLRAAMEKKVFRDLEFRVFRSGNENSPQIILQHGICEHSLRYRPLIKSLNKEGFDCTLIDHPGHGIQVSSYLSSEKIYNIYQDKNQLPEDDQFQKEFYKINKTLTLDKIISFQEAFIDFLFKEKIFMRNQPTFLLGQSMGGLVATVLAEKIPHLTGVILLSPAFKAQAKLISLHSIKEKMRYKIETTIINKSDESFRKPSLFKSFILTPLLALNPPNHCAWAKDYISDLEEENLKFAHDPYIGKKLSLRFLQTIQQQMYNCRENEKELPCPVFLQYGSDDKIVDAEGTDSFAAKRLHNGKDSIRKMEGFQPHEIHNSSRQESLIRNMTDWIRNLS